MKLLRNTLISSVFVLSLSQAALAAGIGPYFGIGLPFLGQVGVNFLFSDMLGVTVGYNQLSLDVEEASLSLTMPEVLLEYHPFLGAFFIAAGVGQETLEVTSSESTDNDSIKIEVEAMTTIVKLGWMWGATNGGFWFGVDASYIMPSGSDTTITAAGVSTSDPNYIDSEDAA